MRASDLGDVLAKLPGISLEAIEKTAALQSRKDRKYLVPVGTLDEVYRQLDHTTVVLEIAGSRSFGYETTYFDTPQLQAYLDSAHDRPRRHKVRTRAYLDTAKCVLEVKTRNRRSQTVKYRMPYELTHRKELTPAAHDFIAESGANDPPSRTLTPALTTSYNRSTLLVPSPDARVTTDTHMAWRHPNGEELALPGLAMVETKSHRGRTEFDRMLWAHGMRPTKISKYCVGLAALTPELKANKWNRILRTHFDWQPAAVS